MRSHQILQFLAASLVLVNTTASPLRGCEKNSTRCFQVFKVSLSTLQEEDLSRNLKPVKKYGNNVFAPRGNSPKLTEKVIESMPANADPRVKENILNNNYFLKRVDADDGSIFSDDLQDLLPQNIQHVQANPSVSVDEAIPVYLIILLIVVGILVGILGTCSVLVFVDYKNNPKFDTSGLLRTPGVVTSRSSTSTPSKERGSSGKGGKPRCPERHCRYLAECLVLAARASYCGRPGKPRRT